MITKSNSLSFFQDISVKLSRFYRGVVPKGGNGYGMPSKEYLVFWIIHSGSVTVSTNDEPSVLAQAGECFVCRQADPRFQRFSKGAVITSVWFKLGSESRVFPRFSGLPVVLDHDSCATLSDACSDALNLLERDSFFNTELLEGATLPFETAIELQQHSYCIFRRLLEGLGQAGVKLTFTDPVDPRIQKAMDHLAQLNYTGAVPYDDLRNLTGLSRTHLDRLFLQESDISPKDFLARRCLEKAMAFLTTTDMPVADIAEQMGFLTVTHFSSWFKRLSRVSPRDYRRNPVV